MALSKNKIKYISSLKLKKYRDEYALFVAEGAKLVADLSGCFTAKIIVATKEWLAENNPVAEEIIVVDAPDDMKSVSQLSSPSPVLAVFYKHRRSLPENITPYYTDSCQDSISNADSDNEYLYSPNFFDKKRLVLAIDGVQDPGNLGTIIRIADWFGINEIVCSENTVDVFNFKTIQATMGALCNVVVHYVNLELFCRTARECQWHVYGTFLDGDTIYNASLNDYGVIVMGNEGNGISSVIATLVSDKLYIPDYPKGKSYSESLNVAVATSIVCNEFRRLPFIKK